VEQSIEDHHTTAQREISTDWIAAYKKYFHTDRPLETAQP